MHRFLPLLFACLPCHAALAAVPQNDALRNYGAGTPGSAGAPTLWADDAPRLGQACTLRLARAHVASAAFPVLAFAAAQSTLAGVEIDVQTAAAFGLPLLTTDASGRAAIPFAIPPLPLLLGLDVYAQVFVHDPTSSSPLQLTSTPGLQLRVAGAPLLFVAEVATSVHDVVDLGTGARTTVAASSSSLAVFSRDGTRLFLAGATTAASGRGLGLVRFFDSSGTPLAPLASPPTFATSGVAVNRMVLSPDGRRLYVVNGNQPFYGSIDVLDAEPGSPGFGTPLVPPVPLPFKSPQDLAFTPDGRFAYVATNGLIEPLGVAMLDTDPSSPTCHQIVTAAPIPGGPLLSCLEMAPAGDLLYLGLNNTSAYDIGVLRVSNFTFVDFDPTTPGVQHLSGLGVAFGTYFDDMVVSPRGGFLYCGEHGGVRRIDVDLASPGLGSSVFVPLGTLVPVPIVFAVAVAPAGDRVYAGEYRSQTVTEFDAAAMTPLRAWTVTNPPEGFAIR